MEIKCLFFDLDNTLVDFTGASKKALLQTLTKFGIAASESNYQQYAIINHGVWQQFEKGQLTAEELRVKRFRDFFDAIDVRHILPAHFNSDYLACLVENSESYLGVPELLRRLKSAYYIGLITNGLKEVQRPRIDKIGLTDAFDCLTVSDEIGISKPHAGFFDHAFAPLDGHIERENVLVIGDNWEADIQGGAAYGFRTCWVSHGRARPSEGHVDFVIPHIAQFEEQIISSFV